MVADEAFRALMVALSRVPSAKDLRAMRHEVTEASGLFEERGWSADPLLYHQDPPELASPTMRKERSWGVEFGHMRFVSGYEPHVGEPGRERWLSYRPTRTAHAWVLRHADKTRPWLICVHGYRMGFPLADFHAFRAEWLHHRLGFNIAMPVLPLHGERKIGKRSGDGFFTARFMDTIHAETQAIWDLRRIIGWIDAQGASEIGVYGISLGGYTTALLAGFDPRLSCVLAGMPTVCFPTLLRANAPERMLRLAELTGLGWDRLLRTMRVVSPLAVAPQVPRERLYMFAGAADRLVPVDHVHDLWKHWDKPTLHWFEGSHLSFTWERAIDEVVYDVLRAAGLLRRASLGASPAPQAA